MITTTSNAAQLKNPVEAIPKQVAAEAHMNPAHEVTRLRTEIEDARDGLGNYVSELDRRRHRALDLKLLLKKHKALAIGVGVVTLAAAAGAVRRMVRSRRQAALPSSGSADRIAAAVAQKPRRLAGFLLGTAVPVALRAARGVVERAASRQPRPA